MAILGYLGRAVMVTPASLGEIFEDVCTVVRNETKSEWIQNAHGGGGYLQRSRVQVPVRMYWYDKDADGESAFVAYSGYGPRIRDELRKRGVSVTEELRVSDDLGEPDLRPLKGVEWRPRQKEIFTKLLAHRCGVVVCPTAFGKTWLIKQLAKVYPGAEIIATVASTDIANDIYEDLALDLGPEVGMVGDSKNNPARVTVAVSKSLHKCRKSANLLLADECHSLLTENYIKLLNRFYRARFFGFTATPKGRSDGADAFAEALFGPVIADVTYQEGVRAGNIVQLKVQMYEVTDGPEVSHIDNKAVAERRGLWVNAARNNKIAEVVRQTEQQVGPDAQILIMVDKTEHAYKLGQLLSDYTIVTGEPVPERVAQLRRNGSMAPEQEVCTKKMRDVYRKQFEANKLKRVIATKIWKQGVDFRDLAVLVRADGTASPIDSGQVPGRLSRLGHQTKKDCGLLIDFVDSFSKNLKGRSMRRMQVYKKNGWHITRR